MVDYMDNLETDVLVHISACGRSTAAELHTLLAGGICHCSRVSTETGGDYSSEMDNTLGQMSRSWE